METKTVIRKRMRMLKNSMTQAEVDEKSRQIIKKLLEIPEFCRCDNILSYINYNQEVVTTELLQNNIQYKNIYVPKVFGERDMRFFRVTDWNSQITAGRYGIPEPSSEDEADYLSYNIPEGMHSNTVVIMPGLCFDLQGNRLGYGGGYYDTFLEKNPLVYKIALCYGFQIYEGTLATESTDVKVDMIITENGTVYKNSRMAGV